MKSGRNSPCPCGSGRKFKRCCAAEEGHAPQQNTQAIKLFEMGNALASQGKYAQAVDFYERSLSIKPNDVAVCNNLGFALKLLGRIEESVERFWQALSIGANAQVHFNLANALAETGRTSEAILQYEAALSVEPDFAEAHSNLANLTRRSRGLVQAVRHFESAITIKPDYAEAYNNLGIVMQEQGDADRAIIAFNRALDLKPDYIAAHNNLLYALNYTESRDPLAVYSAHLEFSRCREKHVAEVRGGRVVGGVPGGRLKIGYVSSDFRRHSVSYFIEPVLESHDRERFEIYCYFNSPVADEVTERIKSKADHWRCIFGVPDDVVARQIEKDGVDILVDLNGHTTNNRLMLFCKRPAPTQITWLGYPNTTGLSSMDYRITDGFADPLGQTDKFHSEKLLRLPESFLCYKPPENAPEVSNLPASSNNYITFGSFNKLAKITPHVMQVWANILRVVPGSRLMLKNTALVEEAMRNRICEIFSGFGVEPDRLELRGPDRTLQDHLAQYHNIDIALDPFPYNGTTTTCEALWMGVPVITLAGQVHVARVGVSQMTNLGLEGLISNTQEEYVQSAERLAHDLEYLSALRKGLRARMAASPLMDAIRFTRNLEGAYMRVSGQLNVATTGADKSA